MKKVTLLCALVLASFGVKAQGFYADFNVGYGLGLPGNVLGTTTHTDILNGASTMESKNLKGSLGQGLTLQLTPGYMFNEHIGVELGINYFLGAKVLINEQTSNFQLTALGINEDYSNRYDHAQSNQLRIIPSVIISTGTSNKISGYAKAGLVMPVLGSTIVTTDAITAVFTGTAIQRTTLAAETEVKGTFSLGFRGAVGLNYNITDNLSIFGELYATGLNIKQKHRVLNSRTIDGVETTTTMTTYDKEIEYVKELNSSSNNSTYNANISAGSPKQELFAKTNFNQFGLQIGVKYNF
ncbi:MAG: outer membrane beta-barrel protein [Flavobacteriia bacterium]|nr:outer membrane beta-barrel protein [Flavobacteriia bacterium]OJX34910.1 MAG: hypothetical protein BGO87_09215 [Flavobacteriia bacterium 40-80]